MIPWTKKHPLIFQEDIFAASILHAKHSVRQIQELQYTAAR